MSPSFEIERWRRRDGSESWSCLPGGLCLRLSPYRNITATALVCLRNGQRRWHFSGLGSLASWRVGRFTRQQNPRTDDRANAGRRATTS